MFFTHLSGMSFGLHHRLACIKKFLRNRWLVLAFVEFAVELERAIVEWIAEHHLDIGDGKGFAAPASKAQTV
jgi:hypothetical protein